MKRKKSYSTFEVSKIIGVSAPTVINWSNEGKIPVYRTPGGHRRISHQSLVDFCDKYQHPIQFSEPVANSYSDKYILVVCSDDELSETISEFIEENTSFKVCVVDESLTLGIYLGLIRPNVLIFDISHSSLNAVQVLRKIRKIRDFKALKTIAYGSILSQNDDVQVGFDGYMLKTDPLSKLLHILQSL